jgi:UDP-GlcNAc:undecaprenyl-phosphate GlcNAc-1-phosphate transferase
VFGVLLWNFPQPRTFLGDGGSTLLGYICASHLAWSIFPDLFGKGFFSLAAVLFFIGGIPVIDTLAAMTRRLLTKKSPFSPDRGHAHHRLLDRGFSKQQTLAIMGIAHMALVLIGLRLLGTKLL